jgi:RNA polymerase sigma-70 factor (ECF subfamily)
MLENLSDKTLLEIPDEHAGFRILYSRYWEALYKKAFFRFGNSADAEDAVQEVFISVWRNKQTIQIDETLSPYLFTALKYYIIKQVYRKAKKGIQVPLSVEKLEHSELTTEELLQYKELQSAIAGEVNELPKRMKEIYRLNRVENLQIAEITVLLNISEQTVKNTLTSALKRLRERLSRYSFLFTFLL